MPENVLEKYRREQREKEVRRILNCDLLYASIKLEEIEDDAILERELEETFDLIDDIFPGDSEFDIESQVRQAQAVIRIYNVGHDLYEKTVSLRDALGVLQGEALEILYRQKQIADPVAIMLGDVEYPKTLREPKHDLAKCAWSLVDEIEWAKDLLVATSDGLEMNEAFASCWGRIAALTLDIRLRWRHGHTIRGWKILRAAQQGHAQVHGTALEKQKRRDAMVKRWSEIKAAKPHLSKDGIDAEVAKGFGVSSKTIQRTRLQHSTQSPE